MRPRLMLRHGRAVNVIIATTALAMPAPAAALATGPQATVQSPNPLKLRSSRSRVQSGQAMHLAGRAPRADAGAHVVLERRLAVPRRSVTVGGGPWRRIATARVGRRGKFSFRLSPRRSAAYRAVLAGSPVAWLAVSSGPLRIVVAARFHVTRRHLEPLGRGAATVGGKLLPASAGRLVVLERRTRHGWRPVVRRRTGRRGGFSVRWRPAGEHPVRLRLMFAGDPANGRSAVGVGSAIVLHPSVASWYYDAGATACGFHATYGVANRTLPCGTHVTIRHGGRTVTAVVDDRGPYVWGRSWDLSQTTAARLGFSGVGRVWVGG